MFKMTQLFEKQLKVFLLKRYSTTEYRVEILLSKLNFYFKLSTELSHSVSLKFTSVLFRAKSLVNYCFIS